MVKDVYGENLFLESTVHLASSLRVEEQPAVQEDVYPCVDGAETDLDNTPSAPSPMFPENQLGLPSYERVVS